MSETCSRCGFFGCKCGVRSYEERRPENKKVNTNKYGKLDKRIEELETEIKQLKKWQIKPTEAICLTSLACRYKKMFKND